MNTPVKATLALTIVVGALVMVKGLIPSSDPETLPVAQPPDATPQSVTADQQGKLDLSAVVVTDATDANAEPEEGAGDRQAAISGADGNSAATSGDTSYQDSIDVLELGKQPFTDVSFRYWVARLRDNPNLLQSALSVYLENRDTPRARHLAAVLAEINSPQVLDTAMQLSQSPEALLQQHGLELLARLQPYNTHARNNAIDLLATQTEPSLLVATLNVFATPAQVVSADQRQLLLDHAQLLTTHADANVRAHSISTIGKWTLGGSNSAAIAGLRDPSDRVRARATASLIGTKNPDNSARQGLFLVAANRDEAKTTRQLALYALSKMPLSENERERYGSLEVELRRTP